MTKTDEELCSASAEGDEAAFAELVRRYQSCVCAITFAATGRRDLGEDLAQETFIIAWRKLAGIKDPSRVGPWLCGIARNLGRKSHRRRVDHPLDEGDARDDSATPEDALAQRRARANHGHIPAQHIPQLWQFIQRTNAMPTSSDQMSSYPYVAEKYQLLQMTTSLWTLDQAV